jgi:hypothetical protein
LATGFAAGRFAAVFFVLGCLSAFRARAFPAGERLVAGLRRVDFTALFRTVEDFDPDREEARDESRFCVFANGLVMLTRNPSQTQNCRAKPAKLSIAGALIQ